MDRASKLDGSIPVPALLFPDETLLADQDSVGLYDGQAKAPEHQLGSIHVTSHRLLYIDSAHPRRNSLEFMLFHVAHTEHYSGFLTSSPKITIIFQPSARTSSSVDQPSSRSSISLAPSPAPDLPTTSIRWECEICGNKNVSTGLVPSTICQLCGVPRTSALPASPSSTTTLGSGPVPMSTSSRAATSSSVTSLSRSLPSSVISTPGRRMSPPPSLLAPSSTTGPSTRSSEEDAQIACPACTFFNYPSLRNCEMCGTVLPRPTRHSLTGPVKGKSAPSSRPASPVRESTGGGDILKVSFRRGGDKQLYAALKMAMEAKVWQAVEPAAPIKKNRTGIHGLVELRRNEVESTATNMQSALQDLEALMKQAKEMVALAESFNRSLKEHEAQRQQLPEDAQFIIGSSMARLGLVSTVPASFEDKGKGRSEAEWLEELAKELTTVLLGVNGDGGLMMHRGMIALDEVWGAWNRARGVALIPPATFMQVLPILEAQTQRKVLTRAFHSNLKVVHTPWYSQRSFTARLLTYLDATGPKNTSEIARQENLSVGLVQEMIFSAEQDGAVVRDEALHVVGGELREATWWRNLFEGYVWDGEVC